MNKILALIAAFSIATAFIPSTVNAIAEWDGEYFTYGSGLSKNQLDETKNLLNIQNKNIEEIVVNSEDYYKYTNDKTNDNSLYSSAVIVKTKNGSGVNVYINTPNNITKIKDHQYINAAITSGVTDLDIIVASPVQVSGESALVGVYKALDNAGVEINEEAAQVANEELTIVKEINENNSDKEGFDSEELTLAIAEIKENIANIENKDSISQEDVDEIINEALNKRNLELSESEKESISKWINKFKSLDIDWKEVGNQLQKIGSKITEKAGEFYDWGQETGFFSKLWESIKSFFNKLFS